MIVLLVVGIGLIIFGGIVLLKFSDKPGGRISIGPFEVSSMGAGLPLIVLGVICLFSYTDNSLFNFIPWGDGNSTIATQHGDRCFEEYFGQIPEDRVSKLEVGIQDKDLISTSQAKDHPIGILFLQNRDPLGGIIFNYFPGSKIFKIASIVDRSCRSVETFSNSSRGGDKKVLQNWDTVEMALGERSYFLRLGYDGGVISANYFR